MMDVLEIIIERKAAFLRWDMHYLWSLIGLIFDSVIVKRE